MSRFVFLHDSHMGMRDSLIRSKVEGRMYKSKTKENVIGLDKYAQWNKIVMYTSATQTVICNPVLLCEYFF